MRTRLSKQQRLQKRREKLKRLQDKKNELRNRRINLLHQLRAKNREQFAVIGKKDGKIWFKTQGGETVQTNRQQITLGDDAEEWEKYARLGERENQTQENIWETQKKIRQDEKAVKKENEKEWDNNYWGKALSYVKENGVDNNLLGRTINHTQRSLFRLYNRPQGRNPTEPRQWLKYNRGRVK